MQVLQKGSPRGTGYDQGYNAREPEKRGGGGETRFIRHISFHKSINVKFNYFSIQSIMVSFGPSSR